MAAGGHFAIALFERDKIIQHKTFHKYIIRAKQGSAQTAHDQKTGGKARSAGANLRRQNMLHLKQVNLIECLICLVLCYLLNRKFKNFLLH
jgi:hypothetical protein